MKIKSNYSFNEFLTESGLDKFCKDDSSLTIRLYHDLNIYGDIAESYIELLTDRYGVDITAFQFEQYFPDEFIGDSSMQKIWYWLFPFLRSKREKSNEYMAFTFQKIKDSISSGKLI